MLRAVIIAVGLALFFYASPLFAEQDPQAVFKTLNFQSGNIALGDHLAEINLTSHFRYLNNTDTETFLTKVWGNPPGAGSDALGMIVPADEETLGGYDWAVVVTYDASGFVTDEDAGKFDYADLMNDMKEATKKASEERVANGLETVELIGWATKPYYDSAAKKLFWAKRLKFGNAQAETLNYNIRILGRRGVLNLNVVAPMDALASVDQRVQSILSMTHFSAGNTYAEFDPKIDKAAAYGLAGLITGGVLAKAGFFKGLIALLLASKKLILVGVAGGSAALWAGVKRLFSRKPKTVPQAAETEPDQGAPSA